MGGSRNQTVTQKTEIPKHIIQATKGSDITSAAFQKEQQALLDYYGGVQTQFAVGGPVSAGIGSMPQAQRAMMYVGGPRGVPPMAGASPTLFNPLDLSSPALSYYMAQGAQQDRIQGYAQGGYIQGPGTGRSDSIPATIHQNGVPVQDAALSDGEFVMTERAVRGAGNGDREAGAARMYEMMRRFEGRG